MNPSPHRIPVGTRLVLTLPFTPELLDGDEYEPFCPGITGTVECWVIGQDPYGPDKHGYVAPPSYTICPYKTHQMGRWPMWEFLARVDEEMRSSTTGLNLDARQLMTLLDMKSHLLERNVPEHLLLPFVMAD